MKKIKKYKVADEQEAATVLSEPISFYGNASILNNPYATSIAIEKGIGYSIFEEIQQLVHLSEQKLADILSLSTKSLQRYKKDKDFRFKPIHSEKLIELAEVANFGIAVFDSKEQFNLWLETPSFDLGNKKPSELLTNSYGIKLVMKELNNIEHGIFV